MKNYFILALCLGMVVMPEAKASLFTSKSNYVSTSNPMVVRRINPAPAQAAVVAPTPVPAPAPAPVQTVVVAPTPAPAPVQTIVVAPTAAPAPKPVAVKAVQPIAPAATPIPAEVEATATKRRIRR